MKTVKLHSVAPTADHLIKVILWWYFVGSISFLAVVALLEWLIR